MDLKEEILSEGLVLEDSEKYKQDMGYFTGNPKVVVSVRNTEEVVKALKIARKYGLSVTPWGSGTSVTGAAMSDGLVIDLSKMNKILDFDDVNWVIHVEAGVILEELNSFLRERGFFFPPDPASSFLCTVGGAIAEGSGGMRCVRYGTMKDWVLALKVVLADGSTVKLGEPLPKNRAGYDLVKLMVGSEGTLGIITEAWLKVIPLPEYKVHRILAFFNNEDEIANTIYNIRKERLQPEIAEFMDYRVLNALKEVFEFNIEIDGIGALLLDIPDFQLDRALSLIKGKVKIAKSDEEREEFYKLRSYSGLAVRSKAKLTMSEDIVVPIKYLLESIRKIRELERKYSIEAPTTAHIGDGNLHPIITYDEHSRERAIEFFNELCEYAMKIGGTISGEHGIGYQKRDLLVKQLEEHNGAKVIEIMRGIRKLFDPEGILNPGKFIVHNVRNQVASE